MKYKSRPVQRNKYSANPGRCIKCDRFLSKEDVKFGCMRCEWESAGTDVPTKRKHLYESRDNRTEDEN